MKFDQELDATGLACPLPIVKAKKALAGLSPGQVLRVLSTDPGTADDMPLLAEQTGNRLLWAGKDGDRYAFLVEKR
jgi:tRNA 2-thiouridine synthesizing protein A